ncbi:betaine-aldehyde dehydrogenase [Exophiala viscosa]|uniref:aldehyde dehydrogenase (NAD(+)) n=1 Tax=Exophiala viscosa TaxID=2486360 RepID=A0AAN6DTU3_9EURO|nr:betaine-aldehyde dehydrogenase [Exophiala viscosa]KAI1625643.1 betaine-aldehyde dehydrogenase [Exophiala viscosa]
MQTFDLYINGTECKGGSGYEDALNPYTEQPWAKIAQASTEDVQKAVEAAETALEAWSKVSGLQRAKLMHKLADLIEEEADTLSKIETSDNGKIRRETKSQMFFSARNYRFFAGMADKLVGETKPLDSPAAFDFTKREPIGVCALVTPWNSPIAILTNKLAPCLAAGNTCVIKPSEFTTASTLYFVKIVERAGFPPGVVNVVAGKAELGQALVTHPSLGRVSFTGSVGIGRIIAKQAAENIVPVTLELGGKSANILLDDAELDRAIPGSVAGIFAASGQTCIAGSRLLVHRSIYDKVLQGILERIKTIRFGDPQDMTTDIGPCAHRGQWEAIHRHIEKAEKDGAKLLVGGRAASEKMGGLFVAPTVFGDVDPASDLAQNEVFGPVLALIPFDTDDEAVKIANGTKFGLAAGVWTSNIRRAHIMANRLNAGQVWVNTYRSSAAMAPFGGFGQSGYGKERGTEALLEYTRLKNVMIDLSEEVRDPFTIKL